MFFKKKPSPAETPSKYPTREEVVSRPRPSRQFEFLEYKAEAWTRIEPDDKFDRTLGDSFGFFDIAELYKVLGTLTLEIQSVKRELQELRSSQAGSPTSAEAPSPRQGPEGNPAP